MHNIKKGQLVWVNLAGIGSEQSGNRPCIVIQNNTGNKFSPTTIVIPLTKRNTKKRLPTHLGISKYHLGESFIDSLALCEQIRIIDKARITSIGKIIPEKIIREIELKIVTSLGMQSLIT